MEEKKEITLIDLWQLLQPSDTFDTRGRYERCLQLWSRLDSAKRTRIYAQLAAKKSNGEFINPNPCFALDDAIQADEQQQARTRPRRQTLSYDDYVKRYGTTEDRDGWKRRFIPEERRTVYEKQ